MELEGARYVFAAYAAALLTLVAWVWMIAAKVQRLDAAAQRPQDAEGTEGA